MGIVAISQLYAGRVKNQRHSGIVANWQLWLGCSGDRRSKESQIDPGGHMHGSVGGDLECDIFS